MQAGGHQPKTLTAATFVKLRAAHGLFRCIFVLFKRGAKVAAAIRKKRPPKPVESHPEPFLPAPTTQKTGYAHYLPTSTSTHNAAACVCMEMRSTNPTKAWKKRQSLLCLSAVNDRFLIGIGKGKAACAYSHFRDHRDHPHTHTHTHPTHLLRSLKISQLQPWRHVSKKISEPVFWRWRTEKHASATAGPRYGCSVHRRTAYVYVLVRGASVLLHTPAVAVSSTAYHARPGYPSSTLFLFLFPPRYGCSVHRRTANG